MAASIGVAIRRSDTVTRIQSTRLAVSTTWVGATDLRSSKQNLLLVGMRGSYRPTCGACDANVSERGGDDRLAICIGLLFVVSLQLRGHVVMLIILGIVGHTSS